MKDSILKKLLTQRMGFFSPTAISTLLRNKKSALLMQHLFYKTNMSESFKPQTTESVRVLVV